MRTPLILAAALLTAAAAHAQTVLRHSNWFPEGQVMRVKVIDPWKEEVAKVTQGRVKIETAPKVIGTVAGQFDAARDGLADIVVFSNGYTPGRFDVLEIGELPFLGDKPEVFGPALHRFYTKHAAPYGEYKGVHPLAVFVVAPPQLFNSKRALKTVADAEPLTEALNGFGPAYIRELRAAFLARLGVESLGEAADQRLLDTTLALLREGGEALRWEPLFFDWFGGFASSARALGGRRGKLYQGEAFDAFRFALFEHAPDRPERLEAPIFAAAEPEEMLIDEVEAIWAAIDGHDDWGPLEAKVRRLREAGEARG